MGESSCAFAIHHQCTSINITCFHIGFRFTFSQFYSKQEITIIGEVQRRKPGLKKKSCPHSPPSHPLSLPPLPLSLPFSPSFSPPSLPLVYRLVGEFYCILIKEKQLLDVPF